MERLIENVHKFPCLWNTELQEYKLNDVKDAAWREVTKECDLPDVKEAKTLWRKLRDGHRQAISRKRTTTGLAVSKSMWKYEKHMEFLLPCMKNRLRTSNIKQESSEENMDDTTELSDNDPLQNEDSSESEQGLNSGYVSIPPKEVTNISLSAQRGALTGDATKIGSDCQDRALQKFFMSMLLTTIQLPERLKLRVQRQIFDIVMEAKEESLTNH